MKTKNTLKAETTPNITEQSKVLFMAYAADAVNWNGKPLVGGNVGRKKEDCGNLTQLKKAGLLTTFTDEGCQWVSFTESGIEFAKQNSKDLSWVNEWP